MIDSKDKQKEHPPNQLYKNPAYEHVQPKLFTATVTHDMKNVSKGKPPMTGKARELVMLEDEKFK